MSASITDFKANPNAIIEQSGGEAIAVLKSNEPCFYAVPPKLFEAMTEAMELLDNSSASISTLTSVISRDQGLVTKILTIANSPLYGLQRKVTSIDFAVMVLGFTELKNIISVLSMAESFKNKTDSKRQLLTI